MAQINKRNILDNAVGAAKIRIENNAFLRARNFADSADVNIAKVNASNVIEFASLPQAAGTPAANSDLVNYSFLQSFVAGMRDPKDAVQLATAAALPAFTAAGSGVGKTLTGNVNGALTVDGVLTIAGYRVLNRSSGATHIDNGIYVVTQVGSGALPFILTRTTDADENAEVTNGLWTWSVFGTANARKGWLLNTADPITVDTTALGFVEIPIPTDQLFNKESITLVAGDITNQYVDLAQETVANSLILQFGGVVQIEGVDYTLSVVSSVTRITFAGDLATAGASELIATDILRAQYAY
ncbi:MAG: hypothetical protein SGI96_21200 [Bacteroidota bacterium]|nr:hypothetical protein [Bacteroidota bacterium]